MKLNYNFAKPTLKQDGTPDYAPAIIRVVHLNHEEWDEPVLDPETGEPTGETDRKSRDWDTYSTPTFPTAEDYRTMNYVPVVKTAPSEPAPTGYHYEATGWEAGEGEIRRTYELVADPAPTPRVFDPYKLMDKLMSEKVWETVKGWIQSDPEGWDRWSKAPDIDESEPMLANVVGIAKEAFGWDDAKVEEILSASVK